jgi:replicative DNA helicase
LAQRCRGHVKSSVCFPVKALALLQKAEEFGSDRNRELGSSAIDSAHLARGPKDTENRFQAIYFIQARLSGLESLIVLRIVPRRSHNFKPASHGRP